MDYIVSSKPNRRYKNKVWCNHITWYDEFQYLHGWLFEGRYVSKNWKVCPVCQTERPTKANVAAATLRFLMDNDQ